MVHGLSEDAVTFVNSYLKRRKQGVKINDTESVFQILLSGIPQGSILGPILSNILINDFIFLLKTFNQEILQPGIVQKNSLQYLKSRESQPLTGLKCW